MKKRYQVIFEGRVQGVGMRGFCMLEAQKRGLTGAVKNLENGMVQVFIQGEENLIDEFLEIIKQGNRFIRIDDYSLKEIPVIEGEAHFSYDWN